MCIYISAVVIVFVVVFRLFSFLPGGGDHGTRCMTFSGVPQFAQCLHCVGCLGLG